MAWTENAISKYKQFAKGYVETFSQEIDCADLAISCLADFASQNSLPVKLKYYSGGWKWHSYTPGETNADAFKRKAMLMLGALNIIDNTRKIQIANAGAGDLIMTKWSSTLGHTRIVTEVKKTDADYFVVWYQGNLPPVIPERREGNFSEIGNVFENRPRRWNFAQFS